VRVRQKTIPIDDGSPEGHAHMPDIGRSATWQLQEIAPTEIKKGAFRDNERHPFLSKNVDLDHGHIHSRKAFGALFGVKGHTIAFIQTFKAVCVDGGMMNKHIWPTFLLDESKAFLVVKPLNCSICHANILLSYEFSRFLTGGCHIERKLFPQKKPPRQMRQGLVD